MIHRRRLFRILLLTLFLPAMLYPAISIAGSCEKWAARAVSVQGTVEVKRSGEGQWTAVKLHDTFCPGDVVRVQKRGRAELALANQPVLRLDQNTVMTIGGMKDERTSLVELIEGAAHFFSRVTRGLEVKTTFVNAGVEGTEFFIRVEEGRTTLSIFEGKVLASNSAGTLAITGGQSAVAEAGKAPVHYVVVRPRDAVQWALYYPPVSSFRPEEFSAADPSDWQGRLRTSIGLYRKGDLSGALTALDGVQGEVRDARFYTYRASMLLTVGRTDEAGPDLDRALAIDPASSDVFALRSIMAVAKNEKEQSLSLARKAVDADPRSANALVALSYAQQASFDLKGALQSLDSAVKLAPEHALAWARLAELQLSVGRRDEALSAAERAVAVNPDLSRTHTILGFASLSQIDTGKAADSFRKAIDLDSSDPLPRLGLGLSMIREGRLAEGAREIEIAASLDPENSVVRSYLGKAYYEEKRDQKATDELNMARQLDPNDPTSYFYSAILEQTTNRPGEALTDMQKSVELNDNRAVYRSRLLLDADLAARNASLARIYSDLGFQQRALVEGWTSENNDPADFSGHRFLADTYSILPRHEIARVSELLQSQLLQPLSLSPIQPHAAESNQFVLSGASPADLSANEFGGLFNRDRVGLLANGIAGSNSTFGDEIAVSGIYRNVSLSAGQYHNQTDGFRQNSDVKDDIQNGFVQASLTPATSVQAEYRHRKTESGDLALRFYQEANPATTPEGFIPLPGYYPDLRQSLETYSTRVGFHHAFSPSSEIIGNYLYQSLSGGRSDVPVPGFWTNQDINTDGTSSSFELQHLFRSDQVKTVVGAGSFTIDRNDNELDVFLVPSDPTDPSSPLIPVESPSTRHDAIDHWNAYGYVYLNVPKNIIFTIGASYDAIRDKTAYSDPANPDLEYDKDKDQVNPKFGMTWNPVPDTTIRAAYFRVLKRPLITNQTLEPTQVSGFNQFFDDIDATDAKSYGVGVDQKFSRKFFGGAEYYHRDLTVPYDYQFIDMNTGIIQMTETRKADWDERLARAYVYWMPHDQWAVSAEYLNERFNQSDRAYEFNLGASIVETVRVPLGVRYFHSSGFSIMARATYIDQKGDFPAIDPGTGSTVFVSATSQFWLYDAAISYRLPGRYGMLEVGGKNLTNRKFEYYDTDYANPAIQPKSFYYARLSLTF